MIPDATPNSWTGNLGLPADVPREYSKPRNGSRLDRDDVKFENGILVLNGYAINTVESLCKPLQYAEADLDFLQYWRAIHGVSEQFDSIGGAGGGVSSFGIFFAAIKSLVDLVKGMLETAKGILQTVDDRRDLALEDEDEPYLTGDDKMTVFKRTLAADVYHHGWDIAEASFDNWQIQMQSMRALVKDLTKDLPDDATDIEDLLPWFTAVFKMYQSKSHLGLFQTQGSILKKHDILQRAICRRLGKTKGDYLALFPEEAQEGDTVVLLKGGKTLYIFREETNGWRFVGDCYVHGVMDGERWDESKCQEMVII